MILMQLTPLTGTMTPAPRPTMQKQVLMQLTPLTGTMTYEALANGLEDGDATHSPHGDDDIILVHAHTIMQGCNSLPSRGR